ncbi:MAG TPA: hypothetical protein PK970_09970, partial [Hyphomicrobiaceae bacterium]|nr:hypothetical protein [Hyphomicrobiaceae bacterium]
TIAAVGSGIWFLLSLLFGWAMIAPELAAAPNFWTVLTQPTLLTVAATMLIPIALFWFLAMLVWRAQELRLMSSAMTEVAVRLAEPDRAAEQSIASLGQSVRKQVGFMNDAVAHAISRAGELEAMVHNEVSTLERSFQENEHRIRNILTELSSERTQLVSTSGDVHKTLRSISDEVPALIEKLTSQQAKLSRIIEGAGQNLIALEGSLTQTTDRLETSLTDTTHRLSSTLGSSTSHLETVLAEYSSAINMALGNRTQQMQSVFEEYTRALDASLMLRSDEMGRALSQRAEALDAALVERTSALDSAFAARLQLMDQSILSQTQAIDGVIGEKARALSAAMETHARTLAETLGRQAVDLDDTLMNGIDAVRRTSESITRQSVKAIEGLSGQADMLKNVSENLLMQIGNVTNRFENQGQSIMRAANALETANFRIDSTLQTRHRELNDTLQKLAVKTTEFDSAIHGYSASLETSLTDAQKRARALTNEMAQGALRQAETALTDFERMKRETEAEAQRHLTDMRSQFGTVSREVNTQFGALSSRINETSSELREQSQRAAAEFAAEQERLRREAQRIPEVTRETAETMRRSLSDHLRALDQLSTLTGRESARRDVTPPLPRPPAALTPPQEQPNLTATYLDRQTQPQVQPKPPTNQVAPPPTPTSANAGSNWTLGDLLARASHNTDPPPPPAPAEEPPAGAPINLEVIAGALDPDTTAAIWSRFRAGQRGIMVRSIYSNDGRRMFDEVVRRYATEPGFRATVDRFLADFERVLRDSEHRDPTGRTVDTHLTSASGRVYLFLAHASGRLA